MREVIKETLEKQLQLLSECSVSASAIELPELTKAMIEIVRYLPSDCSVL